MRLDPIETLRRLIQTPSVNPAGRAASDSPFGEARMTDLLIGICRQQRWPYWRQPVEPARDNLLALVAGWPLPQDGGELILWDVHQDTVSADGMTIDPFGGEVAEGRVFGRGACDVKGSMAAMLAALSRLPQPDAAIPPREANPSRPSILLACTANEECGFTGAKRLADYWLKGVPNGAAEPPAEIQSAIGRRPDCAIVAEPTDFQVVVAHHGVVRWRCHTRGRAAHSSHPQRGANAIYAMAAVVRAVEAFQRHLASDPKRLHPLCGHPSVSVTTIDGGSAVNIVPERATIQIDRRLGPHEHPDAAYAELVQLIAEHAGATDCRIEHDRPFMESLGLADTRNADFGARLMELVQKHDRASARVGARYGTDAAAIAALEIPAVVFGPGRIEQAHTADEHIAVDDVQLATEIFYEIASHGLAAL